jgi:hypothetical protein
MLFLKEKAMNAEFKKGDKVLYTNPPGDSALPQKFKIVDVCQREAPAVIKGEAKGTYGKSLYGKEIQEVSRPTLSFVIEPISGGERLTVKQGEIELIE